MTTRPTATKPEQLGASFRDPSGFLFSRGGILFRQVNQVYAAEYRRLMESGLYSKLTKAGWLVSHSETEQAPADSQTAYMVVQPERVPFVSYPFEWSFSQLKDAALATLAVQKRALKHGMSLKDASAYNIQFLRGRPTFIDSLSFETYEPGKPWVAYRQFCQHFLAPLALMAHVDIRLSQLLRVHIDGVPLALASRLLPPRTRLSLGLLTHLHIHAAAQQRFAGRRTAAVGGMSRQALDGLIASLESTIKGLRWRASGTPWAEYQRLSNYSAAAASHKKQLVGAWLERLKPATAWDLGANTGIYSRLAEASGAETVAFDIDPAAVESNYLEMRRTGETHLLPLLMDLTNPSPALGWALQERLSLAERGPADFVMALALVHHLAISNNVPLLQVAAFCAGLCRWLVIEFVPKDDEQVQKLLAARRDIFGEYTQHGFELAFGAYFTVLEAVQLCESGRRLYLMEIRP
jgi:ribosomal protein L11 methylase PrmA